MENRNLLERLKPEYRKEFENVQKRWETIAELIEKMLTSYECPEEMRLDEAKMFNEFILDKFFEDINYHEILNAFEDE